VGCAFKQAQGSKLVEVQAGWGKGRGKEASSWVCIWGGSIKQAKGSQLLEKCR
jgi:hypothetical protein